MKKWIIPLMLAISLSLSGCSIFHVYQVDTQQGNIVTPKMAKQLKPGMSKAQVIALLGHPLLVDTFDPNILHYVYTFQPGGQDIKVRKHLNIYFKNNKLTRMDKGVRP